MIGSRRIDTSPSLTWPRSIIVVLALVALTGGSCDPHTGRSTLTGTLAVHHEAICTVDGECGGQRFSIDGSDFPPNSSLRLILPAVDAVGLREITVASDVRVSEYGNFRGVEYTMDRCFATAHPDDAPGLLAFQAYERSTNVQRAFAFIERKLVICEPPFTQSGVTYPCGAPAHCPTLTTDSPTSVGVHWFNSDDDEGYVIRYRVMGTADWTRRSFGNDVGDVAVNNLQTRVTYEFELYAINDSFLAFQPVGVAAAG